MTDDLIKYRFKQGKTIAEFAKSIGISHSLYYKIEIGERNPSYSFLCKFKKTYPEASIDSIFFKNILDNTSKKLI